MKIGNKHERRQASRTKIANYETEMKKKATVLVLVVNRPNAAYKSYC
jgi:hypothetical protein